MTALVLRNVTVDGQSGLDVRIEASRIVAIGPRLARCVREIDGRGCAVIPGLADHHIHLLGSAAQAHSVTLDDVASLDALATRLIRGAAGLADGDWVRATGCPPGLAAIVTRDQLDGWVPDRPVRMQDQSGALWLLNTKAFTALGETPREATELDAAGRPTGRLWRADAWVRSRHAGKPPDLAALGRRLARLGVTAVTDTSATNDAESAALLAVARRSGALPQTLMLMSAGPLAAPADGAFRVGPVKVVLDERDLPQLDWFTERLLEARRQRRNVAVHCVTAAELALTLAAFEAGGAHGGDRIEHGSVIPASAIPVIRALGLTLVTQPGLIFSRGDRYLADSDEDDRGDLYRCATLLSAGVPVAFSSDAPYGPADPWVAIRAAATRRTATGHVMRAEEAIGAGPALSLYHGWLGDPGGAKRRVAVGEFADLCLLAADLPEIVAGAAPVAATIMRGTVVYDAERRASGSF